MFQVRIFTPQVVNEEGWPHAGGELRIGNERVCFLVDLQYWSIGDYERQWREGIARLTHGAPSTALMTAYRGTSGDAPHVMFALWRDDRYVYVQQHTVLASELEAPFDPTKPYEHVGPRVATSDHGLPISEWRVDLVHVYAAMFGIRLPLNLPIDPAA